MMTAELGAFLARQRSPRRNRKHSQLARSSVEEYFDAKNVVKHLQERALS